jgi:hypothetical protein
MEVHERGADADRPSRRGARVSALARPASASRAAGPHAQQSTSRSTQRLSLVYSSSLLYTCCTPTPYGVHSTRGECSASDRCVLGLAYRSSYGFICHAARPLSASILVWEGLRWEAVRLGDEGGRLLAARWRRVEVVRTTTTRDRSSRSSSHAVAKRVVTPSQISQNPLCCLVCGSKIGAFMLRKVQWGHFQPRCRI